MNILEILKRRAVEFHRVLSANSVYHQDIPESEYLQRIDEHITHRAQNVATGIEGLELTELSLPVGLMHSLLDVIPAASWDYEFGYANFLEDLRKVFGHTPQEFSWSYEQKQSKLFYSLGGHSWLIENLKLNEDVNPETYIEIRQNLSSALEEQGLLLYDATTGDQSGMLVLIPTEAKTALSDYLIEVTDPRAEWFYEGIPDSLGSGRATHKTRRK